MKKMISKGYVMGGLYMFDQAIPGPLDCSCVASLLQIYCQLGNPFQASLKKLMHSLNSLFSLDCESYQFGKHHRVFYPSRLSK